MKVRVLFSSMLAAGSGVADFVQQILIHCVGDPASVRAGAFGAPQEPAAAGFVHAHMTEGLEHQ